MKSARLLSGWGWRIAWIMSGLTLVSAAGYALVRVIQALGGAA